MLTAVVLLMTAGLVAFFTMPRRENPEFTIRMCLVLTSWPGATAQKVEQLVTDPIEEAIDTIDEVKHVWSRSTVGLSTITVQVEDYVGEEIDNVWDKIRARIKTVRPRLPQGCSEPHVNDQFGDTSVMLLAVYQKRSDAPSADAPRYTPRELEIISERIKDELKLIPAVGRVELFGVRQETITIETDMGRWSQLGLTTDSLQELLQARNIVAPGGSIDTEHGRFSVKPSGEVDTVRELNRVTVRSPSLKAPVYLSDLGLVVRRGYEDPPSVITRYGDPHTIEPCVIVSFTMKDGENVTVLGEQVTRRLREMKAVDKILPADIQVSVISNQPKNVNTKIMSFVANVIQAIVIVVGVAYLIIGFRIALVMAMSIPVVVLASLGIVRIFDVQLEQITIASLIIALGMLVDNAIEVCDQSHRLQHEGWSPYRATLEGTKQIMFPILIATLTTVSAFLPFLVALEGSKREFVYSLPVTVSTTLLVSWVSAMTFVTLMAYLIIRPGRREGSSESPVLRLIGLLRRRRGSSATGSTASVGERYMSFCRSCLSVKWLVVVVSALLLVGAFNLPVGSEFFPSDLREQFAVDIWLPEGSSIAQTDAACRKVERLLQRLSPLLDDEGRPVFDGEGRPIERLRTMRSSVGQGGARWFLSMNPEPPKSWYAQICVRTSDPLYTDAFVEDLKRAARVGLPERGIEPLAGARVVPRPLILGPPVDAPIGLRLYGPGFADMETMRRYGEELKDLVRGQPGTWDVHDTWGSFGYQLEVDIDEDKAKLAGVTNYAVAKTLNAFFSGHYLTTYREEDHRVPVYLRLPRGQRGELEQLEAVYVEGQVGKVPLAAIAEIEPRWEPAVIGRRDLNRMIEVRGRVSADQLANVVLGRIMSTEAYRSLEASLPSGYFIEVGGEQEKTDESQDQLSRSFGISLLLIVLCLVVQYNSFSKPLIILVTLPLALIGALLGLFVTGNSLGFMPQLGILSLFGIVLNTAIVYIEFAEMLIREKLESGEGLAESGRGCTGLTREAFRDCLVRAGRIRILPITLTTLTTVGGLVPLALFGGPLWEGMSYVLIFGLLMATLLTLVVVPCVYAIFVETFGIRTVRTESRG